MMNPAYSPSIKGLFSGVFMRPEGCNIRQVKGYTPDAPHAAEANDALARIQPHHFGCGCRLAETLLSLAFPPVASGLHDAVDDEVFYFA